MTSVAARKRRFVRARKVGGLILLTVLIGAFQNCSENLGPGELAYLSKGVGDGVPLSNPSGATPAESVVTPDPATTTAPGTSAATSNSLDPAAETVAAPAETTPPTTPSGEVGQQVSKTTITVSTTTARPYGDVRVSISGGPGNRLDWVALIHSTSVGDEIVDWVYLNGSSMTSPATGLTSANLGFKMPSTPGKYYFVLFANDGYQEIAISPFVTVYP